MKRFNQNTRFRKLIFYHFQKSSMARHNHRQSDHRSVYTADSLQSNSRARSLSPRQNRNRSRVHHHPRDRSVSPTRNRRANSAPRREGRSRRRRRSQSPSPDRGRSSRRSDRRRFHSCGSLEVERRLHSPSRRHRAQSKGRFTHQLLKILASSAKPRYLRQV